MSVDFVVELYREMLRTGIVVAGPILGTLPRVNASLLALGLQPARPEQCGGQAEIDKITSSFRFHLPHLAAVSFLGSTARTFATALRNPLSRSQRVVTQGIR